MLMYVGAAPDGRQFVHIFIGPESTTAMEMTGGVIVDMLPLLDVLDKSRPALMIITSVSSEADTAEVCMYNMETLGFPVRPAPVNALYYGKRPDKSFYENPVFPGGTVTKHEPTTEAGYKPHPPTADSGRVCRGCGDDQATVGPAGLCQACEAINRGMDATRPLSDEAETVLARVANHLVQLRELGVPVEVSRDPDLLRNSVSVRCGEAAFTRLNL